MQTVAEPNHGSLAYRRAFKAGLPKAYMRDYNEVLEVGKGAVGEAEIALLILGDLGHLGVLITSEDSLMNSAWRCKFTSAQ